jgi:hypothetical protein
MHRHDTSKSYTSKYRKGEQAKAVGASHQVRVQVAEQIPPLNSIFECGRWLSPISIQSYIIAASRLSYIRTRNYQRNKREPTKGSLGTRRVPTGKGERWMTVVPHKRVTDHTNTVKIALCWPSGSSLPICTNFAFTSTTPFSKTMPSQSWAQLSGQWQNIGRSMPGDVIKPFSGLPTCKPNITEPGSGESSPARARATYSCLSSLKRWKKDDACIANTRPCNGLSEVRLHRSRAEPSGESVGSWTDAKGGTVSRCFGSKASPGTNAIGYVPCVVLKSLCPMSANSAGTKQVSKEVR